MRKQDLRKFDINLMISILSLFCIASLIFLLLWIFNFILARNLDVKFLLWLSYSTFFIIALVVYLATKQTTIIWVKPLPEKELKSKSVYKLETGQSYIIKTKKKSQARDIFKDAVDHGKQGMLITRTNPKILKKRLKLKNTFLLWLTEINTNNAIDPTDIEELSYTIKKYMKKTTNPIMLFEGVEYLINVLPFKKVLHLIQDLRDEIALRNANFLLKINPNLINLKHLKLIEKEFIELKRGLKHGI